MKLYSGRKYFVKRIAYNVDGESKEKYKRSLLSLPIMYMCSVFWFLITSSLYFCHDLSWNSLLLSASKEHSFWFEHELYTFRSKKLKCNLLYFRLFQSTGEILKTIPNPFITHTWCNIYEGCAMIHSMMHNIPKRKNKKVIEFSSLFILQCLGEKRQRL